MGATNTANGASADTASKDLSAQINYQTIYAGLGQHGIILSDDEKRELERIVTEEIRKQNGGQLAGANIGAIIPNIVQVLLSFIQQLFGNNTPQFSIESLTGIVKDAASGATNSGKQQVFNTASVRIHDRLYALGGNFAASAGFVAGLSPSGPAPDFGNAAIVTQLAALANLPLNTTSTLNRQATQLADADVNTNIGNGLPAARVDSSPAKGLS